MSPRVLGRWCSPTPFRGMGARRNSLETEQSSHAPTSRPEIKDGRSSEKYDASERLRCEIMQKVVS